MGDEDRWCECSRRAQERRVGVGGGGVGHPRPGRSGRRTLAGRMAATSADLASTAVSFTAQDEQSAALISRVAEGI